MADTIVMFDPTAGNGSQFKSTAVRAEIGRLATANASPGSITETLLATDSVTEDKIGPEAVGTPELQPGAVTATILGSQSVTTGKILPGAVTPAVLGTGIPTALDAAGNFLGIKIVVISATAYAALSTKDSSTLYLTTP